VPWTSGAAGRAAVPSGASTGEHEASSCGTATRALPGQGRARRPSDHVNERSPELVGLDATRAAREIDRAADRPRRHAQQGQAGRQRDPGRVAWRSPAPPPSKRSASRSTGTSAAPRRTCCRADDEHPQRRRARDNNVDFQEFMIVPGRRRVVLRGAAHGARGLPRAQEGPEATRGLSPPSATRAASPRTSRANEDALSSIIEAIEKAGYAPGRRSRLALDAPAREFYKEGKYTSRARVGTPTAEMVELYAAGCESTRSSRSRTAWPRTTGRAGSA
jgi:enolase